jgi:hypothetical protein
MAGYPLTDNVEGASGTVCPEHLEHCLGDPAGSVVEGQGDTIPVARPVHDVRQAMRRGQLHRG